MLELIGLIGLLAALILAGGSARQTKTDALPPLRSITADLVCPWCRAVTHESDERCWSCEQRFGRTGHERTGPHRSN